MYEECIRMAVFIIGNKFESLNFNYIRKKHATKRDKELTGNGSESDRFRLEIWRYIR